MSKAKLILKSGKDASLFRYHPWLFSGAIKKITGNPKDGDLVDVYDEDQNFKACGHYQIGSIAVRILSFETSEIDLEFYQQKIRQALEVRTALGLTDNPLTNVYRLIHGEGDFLPGLVIDIYNSTAVVQFHSVGMFLQSEIIYTALRNAMGNQITAIYNKSQSTLPFKAPINPVDEYVLGAQTTPIEVIENGHRFLVDWVNGQKTGFFIDQRENRMLIKSYSQNRDVLNVFGFTGGFSIYALAGEARKVHSVDSSKSAIEMTDKNVALNFGDEPRHSSFAVDAFNYLDSIDQLYDMIILDPPAFAKHQQALNNALQGYKKINQKAIKQIRKGGILFTFSCSQAVSRENFRKSVFAAAANSGRKVRILHQLNQPADHPVSIYHPEGEYLKGLVLQIDD